MHRGKLNTFVAPELASILKADRMVLARGISRDGNGYASNGKKNRGIKEWRKPIGSVITMTEATHKRYKAAAEGLGMSLTGLHRSILHAMLPQVEKAVEERAKQQPKELKPGVHKARIIGDKLLVDGQTFHLVRVQG